MQRWHIATFILLIIVAVSALGIGAILVAYFTGQQLENLSSSLQVVVSVFTASAGSLALTNYWRSVEAELQRKRWEKLNHLESSCERFRQKNEAIIQAFDWSHVLRTEYLPLCKKAVQYNAADREMQATLVSPEEISKLRALDDFLEYYENIYFAISRGLITIDDLLVFQQYYITLLGDAYHDPEDLRLKYYVDNYYNFVQFLLNDVSTFLKRNPKRAIGRPFPNYPRGTA